MTTSRAHIFALQMLTIGLLVFGFILSYAAQNAFAQSYLVTDSTSTAVDAPITVSIYEPATSSESASSPVETSSLVSGSSNSMTRSEFENESGTLLDNSASVRTDDDLTSFIRSTLATDTRISAIETDSMSVSVSVEDAPAFLMGFIATSIPVTVRAEATGDVTLSHPEHSFVLKARYDDQLAANAGALIKPFIPGAGSERASLTPHAKAQMIEAVAMAINETK